MKYLLGYLTLGAVAAIGYVAGMAFTIYKYEASDYFAEDELDSTSTEDEVAEMLRFMFGGTETY